MDTEKINRLMEEGLSCGQVVLVHFEDQLGLPAESLKKISAGFEVGGFDGGKCGALNGAVVAMGLLKYRGDDDSKVEMIRSIHSLNEAFKEKFSTSTCEEMLKVNPSNEEGLRLALEEEKIQTVCPEAIKLAISEVEKCL